MSLIDYCYDFSHDLTIEWTILQLFPRHPSVQPKWMEKGPYKKNSSCEERDLHTHTVHLQAET